MFHFLEKLQKSLESPFPYVLKINKRARSARITISPGGEVVVTVPFRMPTPVVNGFLHQSKDWVEKHLTIHKRRMRGVLGEKKEQSMLYLGDQYRIAISESEKNAGVEIDVSKKILNIHPVSLTPVSVEKALTRWLKSEAERFMLPELHKLAEEMDVEMSSAVFRDQKSRWGSCSVTGAINMNWRLIQAPKEVMRYVMIHELAHRKEMNHSERFWRYVERFDPNYADHRRWLRYHGAALHQSFAFHPSVGSNA